MSLAALLARAAGETRRLPPGALVVLGVTVPAAPVERLLAARVPGERALIVPGDRAGIAVAGLGAAARVQAEGPTRFARARDRARALFAAVIHVDDDDAKDAPAPRLLGGFSFAATPRRAAPWEAFGAVDLALPRWTYFARADGEGPAFLRLAVAPAELKGGDRLLAELADVETALATGLVPAPPSAARVDEPDLAPWDALVRDSLAAIAAGKVEKVVPARRLHATAAAPFDPLAAVAAGEPGTTRFLFEREGTTFVGRTPERLVEFAGGTIRCDGLAGSIPRAPDPAEDAARIAALRASEKDLREHAVVVRGIVEDLGRYAELAPTPPVPAVRTLRTVHHLHTPIEGTVRGAPHLFDLAAALHPTAAVAGRPRAPAVAFLEEREGLDRGWYAAPIGWVDGDGEGELFVALRSAALRGAEAWAYAGAGVVAGSDPAAEWRETAAKAAAILGALGVPA
jgi:isochorismate synthase